MASPHRHGEITILTIGQTRGAETDERSQLLEAILLAAVFEQRRVLPQMPGNDVPRQPHHALHGVGRYVGLETREVGGFLREYLVLEYASSDRLFVPYQPAYHVLPTVGITGEVEHPGAYPILPGKDRMSDLIRWAGGFRPRKISPGSRTPGW